ncbi:kinase-like protein [Ceratobasidium sp. AG-I]|nr:kinase-like protein [Ceratobasidium sp. AG-I]
MESNYSDDLLVHSSVSAGDIISRICGHGCPMIADRLDVDSCGLEPIHTNGGFDVHRGWLFDGFRVAIKTALVREDDYGTPKPLERLAEELHTWSKCRHRNVLPLLGVMEFRSQIGMVTCWMENGSLPAYLERHPEVDRCRMCAGICEGLVYLHTKRILHCDLKGMNVLISQDGKPMLAEIGGQFYINKLGVSVNYVTSLRWMAPELLVDDLIEPSFAADVYALGMTILETITGRPPYFGMGDIPAMLLTIRKRHPPRPEYSILPNGGDGTKLWSLLTSCWVYDPEARVSADHVRDTMNRIAESGFNIFGVESSSGTHISSLMSPEAIISKLGAHGCQNITVRLNPGSFGHYPVSSGGFGDVYRGRLFDKSQVAVKTMRIHVNSDKTHKPLKDAARELHTWSQCRHPNVLQLLGLVEFRNQIGMVSHWMENGSLPLYLEKYPKVDRFQMSTGICEGLVYLHTVNIVHGDLKGLNVLISSDGAPMLTDFGNAVFRDSALQFTATTIKNSLSPRWAAPELMEDGTYSFAADVYALGMTILETVTGMVPYSEKSDHGVYLAVAVKRLPPLRPERVIPSDSGDGNTLWSLLTNCWAYDPENRPTADRVRDVMKSVTQERLKIDRVESGGE